MLLGNENTLRMIQGVCVMHANIYIYFYSVSVGVPVALLSVKSEKVLSEKTSYELQCDVISVPVQNLTVKWYKNNETVDVKGFSDTTSTLVNKSYILEVNVSREEKTAQFRCEAQPELEPPNLVVSQTLSLSALCE